MSTVTTYLNLVKPATLEQYALATYNNNLDLIDTHLKDTVQKYMKGTVYENEVDTSSGSVTDAIINNIASFTFKAGRRYRIEWDFSHSFSGNADSLFYCSINTCSTADGATLLTGLTTLNGRTKGQQTYNLLKTWYTGPVVATYAPGASDTTLQIKFRAKQAFGDDGMVIAATVSEKVRYSIIDMGAQI